MKLLALLSVLALTTNAFASDHWDYCSSADGGVKMENGTLYIDGEPIQHMEVKVLQTLKKAEEKCILADSNPPQEVIAYDNTVSVEEVSYKYLSTTAISKTILLCERGGSGIPAAATCAD